MMEVMAVMMMMELVVAGGAASIDALKTPGYLGKGKPSLQRVDNVERAAHLKINNLNWIDLLSSPRPVFKITPECFSRDSQMRRTLENQNMSWSRGINT